MCVGAGCGDRGVLGQCEVDGTSGEPLDRLSGEAIKFCQNLGSQASTVTEVLELRDPLVYKAIQQGIDAVNQEAVSNAQKIQKWVILARDFSISGGELGEWPGEPVALARGGWSLASGTSRELGEGRCPLQLTGAHTPHPGPHTHTQTQHTYSPFSPGQPHLPPLGIKLNF